MVHAGAHARAARRPRSQVATPQPEAETSTSRSSTGTGTARCDCCAPTRGGLALLLERLHPEDLTDLWDVEACEIVAGFYARLHVPAPPQLVTLSSCVRRWVGELAALPRDAPSAPTGRAGRVARL